MTNEIENILKATNLDNGVWMGYPEVKDGQVYINAKGRDLNIVKAFRDTFGGTANAGSVKVISKLLRRKENGFYFVIPETRMKEILNGIEA